MGDCNTLRAGAKPRGAAHRSNDTHVVSGTFDASGTFTGGVLRTTGGGALVGGVATTGGEVEITGAGTGTGSAGCVRTVCWLTCQFGTCDSEPRREVVVQPATVNSRHARSREVRYTLVLCE